MISFIAYFIIWVFLSWPIDVQHVIAGLCVSALVTFLTSEVFVNKPKNFKEIKRYGWFAVYMILLAYEYAKASLIMSQVIFKPAINIVSGISEIRTELKTRIGITFLANSITFMPGTFCIDADIENSVLYVHCLHADKPGVDKIIKGRIGRFEGILKRIFE